METKLRKGTVQIEDPWFTKMLFGDSKFAWIWAVLRIYLGYSWITSGWGKVMNPKWVVDGTALQGWWANVVKIPAQGRPPINYDWYRSFIQMLLDGGHHTWFAKVVAYGEVFLGIALIIGALTGFAAFAGAFANMNFMLAGTTSSNPVLFLISVLLILAWKVAGYYGVDHWLLPKIGTPWKGEAEAPPIRAGSGA